MSSVSRSIGFALLGPALVVPSLAILAAGDEAPGMPDAGQVVWQFQTGG